MADGHDILSAHSGAPGMLKDGMTYSQRLFHHTYASQTEDAHFLEFRLLQRLNLVQLQNELARHKGAIWKNMEASEDDMRCLRVTLSDYGEYVFKPCQYMCKRVNNCYTHGSINENIV